MMNVSYNNPILPAPPVAAGEPTHLLKAAAVDETIAETEEAEEVEVEPNFGCSPNCGHAAMQCLAHLIEDHWC